MRRDTAQLGARRTQATEPVEGDGIGTAQTRQIQRGGRRLVRDHLLELAPLRGGEPSFEPDQATSPRILRDGDPNGHENEESNPRADCRYGGLHLVNYYARMGGDARLTGLIAEISRRFSGLAAEGIDAEIDRALEDVVELLGTDRASLIEVLPEDGGLVITHSWARPGLERAASATKLAACDSVEIGHGALLAKSSESSASGEVRPDDPIKEVLAWMDELGPCCAAS